MAAPTGIYYEIAMDAATAALDSDTERLAYTGDGEVDDGGSDDLSFGSVNIAGGAANSALNAMLWRVSAWNSNTSITNFRFWVTENFAQAASKMKWVHCMLDATSEWVPSATISSYSAAPNGGWADMDESEPAANIVGADGSSTTITAAADDTLEAMVMYAAIAASETLGTYTGTGGSYDLQFSLKFDYS